MARAGRDPNGSMRFSFVLVVRKKTTKRRHTLNLDEN